MNKKIYLAGSCSSEDRTFMVKVGNKLREQGYEVYCPFELQIPNAWDLSPEEWSQKVFETDIAAIQECDYFYMISMGRLSSAGSNFEQGYVYALNKPIFVFQITNEPTSLMTFCGATYFLNTNKEHIFEALDFIKMKLELEYWKENLLCTKICKTTLT